ncbi:MULTISPECIES: rhomboid family intramembrane serine protease GlpG [Alteromonas]|uniref:Rhomboid family intramembrane serine protease GlpG n=1 Tax=Alteromonas stellipolaris TaxID=233316 RepID=A0AAW7Z4V6_9ALTE|nr:rhomboid family intramembrane serine protease GlpG [Alteromonas stellipolaris]MDO6577636.1 rhomboid family intramembrane serine protease GlpG [Alteromonas stellipolaris]MDP2596612.1 rhomboid family intramembrane serine protease GlpG [Alteromonas stellipolaris]
MSHPLIAFRQQGVAHLLANYLGSQNIRATVKPTEAGDEFVVLLADDNDALKARAITEEFIQQPNNPKYQQAAWQHGENVDLVPSRQFDAKGFINNALAVPFTSIVFLLCVLVYGLSLLGLFSPIAQHLLMQPLSVLAENHEWWRLLGPAFIHFSALHIIFNLLWWCMLGAKIESTFGKSMLFVVFALSAIISNVAQAMFTTPVQGNLMLFGGLSGVVYAVMGFVWWLGWLKPQWGLSLPKSVIGFMLVWLVLGFADILWVNMANAAHTAGLITGCLLAGLLSLGADKRKQGQ